MSKTHVKRPDLKDVELPSGWVYQEFVRGPGQQKSGHIDKMWAKYDQGLKRKVLRSHNEVVLFKQALALSPNDDNVAYNLFKTPLKIAQFLLLLLVSKVVLYL